MPGKDGAMRASPLRVLGWWPPLFALWMLFAGEWSWQVGVWGAGLSLIAAVSGNIVARHGLPGTRGRWGWWREGVSAAGAVVADFGIVTGVLAGAIAGRRREAGTFRQDVSAAGTGPLAAGRRAWVELAATWSPNCYVVDISPESGRRLVHDLRPHRSSEEPS